MTYVTAILEYTPFLQFLILYVFLYFQDIGRFLHPRVRKERRRLSDWQDVLVDLKLASSSTSNDLRKLDERSTITRRQKISYILFIAPAIFSTLTDLFFLIKVLSWYMVVAFQTVSAILLMTALSLSYLGGTASYIRKHSTKLREGRKSGSRIKHLSLEK